MSEKDTPLERAVELLVYAPIGLAMFAKDTVPTFLKMFVARGQTEVAERRKSAGSQATQYKTIGQMAVKYGGPEVKRQAGAAAETVRKRAEETLTGFATPAPTSSPAARPTRQPEPASKPVSKPVSKRVSKRVSKSPSRPDSKPASKPASKPTGDPSATELPIPGYDLLSASQVIERLVGLAGSDLLAVKAYEAAHRARTTILGKIAQLTP